MSINGRVYDPRDVVVNITGRPPADDEEWNPRFTAYARSCGFQDPQAFLDTKPNMLDFMTWNKGHICTFGNEQPDRIAFGTLANGRAHKAYDAWLLEKYPIVG